MDWMQFDWSDRQKRKTANGYWEVYLPEHPFNNDNYMLIHRLIMENYIKRYLDPNLEIVHHINEDKECNEIWNLFLTNPEEHIYIHRLGKKHSRYGRAAISRKHRKIAEKRRRNEKGQFLKEGDGL